MIYNVKLRAEVKHDVGEYDNEIKERMTDLLSAEEGEVLSIDLNRIDHIDEFNSTYEIETVIDSKLNEIDLADDLNGNFIPCGKFDIEITEADVQKSKTEEQHAR